MKKKSDSENYLKISNDADGFKELLAWFKKKRIKLKDIVVGMENTGAYGYDLRLFLEQTEVDYSVYMPFTLKHALGLVRGKNDKLDAERIAYYTWLHREELTYSRLSGSTVIRLQELIAERKSYIKQLAVHKAFITEKEGKPGTLSLTRALQSRDFLENQIKDRRGNGRGYPHRRFFIPQLSFASQHQGNREGERNPDIGTYEQLQRL